MKRALLRHACAPKHRQGVVIRTHQIDDNLEDSEEPNPSDPPPNETPPQRGDSRQRTTHTHSAAATLRER